MPARAPLHAVPDHPKGTLEDAAFKSAYREGKAAGEASALREFASDLDGFGDNCEWLSRSVLIASLLLLADNKQVEVR
jgi:hypothetical protein